MTQTRHKLPEHAEEALQAIGKLHAEHYGGATPMQRAVNRMTALLARPTTIGYITAALLVWVIGNLVAARVGHGSWDPVPFSGLQTIATIGALYATVLILVTQRHADELAGHREQLILQLVMLGDQKSAKIIQLLEEMRRDDPLIANREDQEAVAMSQPPDPTDVIAAIKDTVQQGPVADGSKPRV